MNDTLFILRSLDPLVVLSVDPLTGICHCIHGADHPDPIAQHRGGGPAEYTNGFITGFGHRTHTPELHTVFHYTIDPKNWTLHTEPVEVIGADKMGIIDPTSSWPGHCAICATPTFWWQWQPVLHGLFQIEH